MQARQFARELATEMGFSGSDVTRIASAISEIARNILDYAHEGEIAFERVQLSSLNNPSFSSRK